MVGMKMDITLGKQHWCLFKNAPCFLSPFADCESCIQFWNLPIRQKETIKNFLNKAKLGVTTE